MRVVNFHNSTVTRVLTENANTQGDVKEFRICRLCMENEVDGVALLAASDDDLLELGFDPVSVRKLRSKLDSIGHDNSAEQRVAELAHFLRSSGLGHLRDRLMNQLGVFDRDELPILISDKRWVKSIGLSVADEIKFKSAVRQYAQEKVTAETAAQVCGCFSRIRLSLRAARL